MRVTVSVFVCLDNPIIVDSSALFVYLSYASDLVLPRYGALDVLVLQLQML